MEQWVRLLLHFVTLLFFFGDIMAKSVETKFSITPEEQIFGVDPFKAVSNTTLNNIVSKSGSFGGGVANLLGTAGGVAATAGIVNFVASGKLDKDYIVNKLGSTLKIDTTFISKTPIANAGKLLQSVGLIDDKTANLLSGKDSSMSLIDIYTTVHNGYKTTINNVDKLIKDDMFDSFTNFTNALISLNPNVANLMSTIGLGEELALLTDIVKQTVALEIPGLIDSIIKDIKDEKTQKAVLAKTLPNAVQGSNLDLINIALDNLGVNTVKGMYPTIIGDILRNYKDSADTSKLPLSEHEVKLFELLNRIDKNWYQIQRNGVWVMNLDVFRGISEASKQILYHSTNDNIRSVAMIGHLYKPEQPLVIAKKYYPYI